MRHKYSTLIYDSVIRNFNYASLNYDTRRICQNFLPRIFNLKLGFNTEPHSLTVISLGRVNQTNKHSCLLKTYLRKKNMFRD